MRTLFIGDLHLSADRPDITQTFLYFLHTLPKDTQALYILGDLFEVWVGDDIAEPFALELADQLKKISQQLPIYYLHGNRDFLLSHHYAKRCGMQLLPEVYTFDLYGQTTVLLHGDSLCTLDKAYQRFRRFRSIAFFRWLYCKLPKQKRLQIASNLRNKSKQQNQQKSRQIMDVEPEAVFALMHQQQASLMIHGHTHRPDIHLLESEIKDRKHTRAVVGDWYTQGSVLEVTADKMQLLTLAFESSCDSSTAE